MRIHAGHAHDSTGPHVVEAELWQYESSTKSLQLLFQIEVAMNNTSSGRHVLLVAALLTLPLSAGEPGAGAGTPAINAAPPANWTAAQDHRNMMEQLGITKLRPGPSGRAGAPD